MAVKVRSSPKREKASCPYCKSEFLDTEKILTCGACQTSIHEDCAKEAKRCTTIGCEKLFLDDDGEFSEDFKKVTPQSLKLARRPAFVIPMPEEVFTRVMTLVLMASLLAYIPLALSVHQRSDSPNFELFKLLLLELFVLFTPGLAFLIVIGTAIMKALGSTLKLPYGRIFCRAYFSNMAALIALDLLFVQRPGMIVMLVIYSVIASVGYILTTKMIGDSFS